MNIMKFEGIFTSKADYVAKYCGVEHTDDTRDELCSIALELIAQRVVLFIPSGDKFAVYLGG